MDPWHHLNRVFSVINVHDEKRNGLRSTLAEEILRIVNHDKKMKNRILGAFMEMMSKVNDELSQFQSLQCSLDAIRKDIGLMHSLIPLKEAEAAPPSEAAPSEAAHPSEAAPPSEAASSEAAPSEAAPSEAETEETPLIDFDTETVDSFDSLAILDALMNTPLKPGE